MKETTLGVGRCVPRQAGGQERVALKQGTEPREGASSQAIEGKNNSSVGNKSDCVKEKEDGSVERPTKELSLRDVQTGLLRLQASLQTEDRSRIVFLPQSPSWRNRVICLVYESLAF